MSPRSVCPFSDEVVLSILDRSPGVIETADDLFHACRKIMSFGCQEGSVTSIVFQTQSETDKIVVSQGFVESGHSKCSGVVDSDLFNT